MYAVAQVRFVTVLSFFFEHVYRFYLNQVGTTAYVFYVHCKATAQVALGLHPHVMA
jgi:hypothetical protein